MVCVPAEDVCEATDDLAEDHARVAARAAERGIGKLLRNGLGPGCIRPLERIDDRPDGEGEVRARVAVGDGVDVEVVDPLAAGLEPGERGAGELAGADDVDHDLRAPSMCTVTAEIGSPVMRPTS